MLASSARDPRATVLCLDDIEEGVTRLRYEVSGADLELTDLEYEIDGSIEVGVTVGRTMQMFTVEAQLRASVTGECSRCLAPARTPVKAKTKFLLQRREISDEEAEALAEEDAVDIVDPGVREVDLGERLHDALILDLPLRLYCKADCRGLCAHCGQDLNAAACTCAEELVDPRWEALAHLKQ